VIHLSPIYSPARKLLDRQVGEMNARASEGRVI